MRKRGTTFLNSSTNINKITKGLQEQSLFLLFKLGLAAIAVEGGRKRPDGMDPGAISVLTRVFDALWAPTTQNARDDPSPYLLQIS
jgi:hypothetical protein